MNYKEFAKSQLDEIMVAGQLWNELIKTNKNAVNTTVGIITNPSDGSVWRPESVQKAIKSALSGIEERKDYGLQSQSGHANFLDAASATVIGKSLDTDLLAYQTAGGTRAISLTRDILFELVDHGDSGKIRMMVDVGWPNYGNIFKRDFEIIGYEHQNYETGEYNHIAAIEAIEKAGIGAVLLLQVASYNNDGLGRTNEQWNEVFALAKKQDNIVVLDSAYLGLGQGFEKDRYPITTAIEAGLLTFECFSTSKIMGLYGERLGVLFIANAKTILGEEQAVGLDTAAKKLIRGTESSNSRLIAETGYLALKDPDFLNELETMRQRIVANRKILSIELGDCFPQIGRGEGLFVKLYKDGFSEDQLTSLRADGIHVMPSSRINLAGMNTQQANKVAKSLRAIV